MTTILRRMILVRIDDWLLKSIDSNLRRLADFVDFDMWSEIGLVEIEMNFVFVCCRHNKTTETRGEQWTEIISWEPRAFVYHNFLVSFV